MKINPNQAYHKVMAGNAFNSLAIPLGGNPTVSSTIKETPTSNNTQQKPAPDQSWGDRREFILNSDDATIRLYSQNVNGLFGKETGLKTAFHQLQSAGTSIFCIQKTHQDKLNQLDSQRCGKTKKDVWDNQGCPCYIKTSSTLEKLMIRLNPVEQWLEFLVS